MSRHSTPSGKRPRTIVSYVVNVFSLGVTILVAWALWPAFLGGSSQMIVVHGRSMEPTYRPGELVLIDTDVSPDIGDIIVFHIPDGELGAGGLVVHRVIGLRADGTYITQGDNTQNADEFRIARSDIVGSPRFSLPYGGLVIGVLSSPMAIGAMTGLVITVMLWPRKASSPPTEFVGLAIDDQGWSSLTISEDEFAEAEAWLHSQLVQVP